MPIERPDPQPKVEDSPNIFGDVFDSKQLIPAAEMRNVSGGTDASKGSGKDKFNIADSLKQGMKDATGLILSAEGLYSSMVDARVPGAKLIHEGNGNEVKERNAANLPTKISAGAIDYSIQYDGTGRVKELSATVAGNDTAHWRSTVKYDGKTNTQTITSLNGNNEVETVTTNHFDKEGKLEKEVHSAFGELTTSTFDKEGRISEQKRVNADGSKFHSRMDYENDSLKEKNTIRIGANGKVESDEQVLFGKDGDWQKKTIFAMNQNDRHDRTIVIEQKNDQIQSIKESHIDEKGKVDEITEMKLGRKYLVSEISRKSADGEPIQSAKVDWQTPRGGGFSLIKGIELSDAKGKSFVVNGRSSGDEASLFKAAAAKVLEYSNVRKYTVEESKKAPGASILNILPGA